MAENPQSDYVIDENAERYASVTFADTMGRLFFKTCRAKAGNGDLRAVRLMNNQLSGANPRLASKIRSQLKREYGCDPLGPECNDAPANEVTSQELQDAINSFPP